MEYLSHGITWQKGPGSFPLSTDSMVLAHFVRLPRQARVLDLGSGCGTLGLLLCARDPRCQITGLEIDPQAHAAALENIRRNGLSSRMESICAPVQSVSARFSPGAFSCCVSNPPYFSGGMASQALATARQTEQLPLPELFQAAAWGLKFGGDFFLVHKPEELARLIALGARHRLEAKQLCLVRHRPERPVSLILLQFRKGARPGLAWQEWTLHSADGSPSPIYRQIYHLPERPEGL